MQPAWEQPTLNPVSSNVLDLTCEELTQHLVEAGYAARHATTVFGLLQRYSLRMPERFDPRHLPKGLWQRVTCDPGFPLDPIQSAQAHPSLDGSTKYEFSLRGGQKVEAVFMPFLQRNTLCISSQVGCAMGCTFCATGTMGFKRHLSAGEMVSQVLHMRREHPDRRGFSRRFNVVFMGMGEPLHNLHQVMKAVAILTDPNGLNMPARDIAVSTSGLVSRIEQLAGYEKRPQLMVSLAATTDRARSAIMPVNRAYPLADLVRCLKTYPLRKGERIMLSYVLIAGRNDKADDARRLADIASEFPSMVNLIPMNEHEGSPGMREPSEAGLQRFYERLTQYGVFATVRRSRGRDVAGACGQLVQQVAR